MLGNYKLTDERQAISPPTPKRMRRLLLAGAKLIPQEQDSLPGRLCVVLGNAIKRSVHVYCCESSTSIIRLTAPPSHNGVAPNDHKSVRGAVCSALQ